MQNNNNGSSKSSRKKFIKQALLLGVSGTSLGAALAACGDAVNPTAALSQPPPAGPTAAATTTAVTTAAATTAAVVRPKLGGTLVLLGHTAFSGLSPLQSGGSVDDVAQHQLLNGLMELDETF